MIPSAQVRSLANALVITARLGAVVGIAFALVEALAGSAPTSLVVARQAAEGAALGALSGLGIAVALVFSGAAGWQASAALPATRPAAALITLWVALTALRRLPAAGSSQILASETTSVVAAVGSVLLLLLIWRALLYLLDRVSATEPTAETFVLGLLAALWVEGAVEQRWGPVGTLRGCLLYLVALAAIAGAATIAIRLSQQSRRRIAGLGQPLRRLWPLGWAVLGLGALGLLALVPEPRRDSRSPDATKTSHRRKEVFLRSPGLGSQVLLKVGREVRTVGATAGPTDLDYAVDGARRVELAWGTGDSSSEAHFRALVKLPDGRKTVLLDERVQSGGDEGARWFSRLITLPTGTEAGTVILRTRGTSTTSFWAAPVFSGRQDQKTRRNVIVVSLDTVRADHLNAYGYTRRRTSPELDTWAGEGTLFENAASTAPGTLSSQMSVLTGRYPSSHGVSYANWRVSARIPVLPVETPTLAEVLSAEGFVTAAFTGSGYFALPLGYSRGFGAFVSTNDESLGSAASVFEKAFVWLDRYRDDPFFLFLHTYEAHEPYLDQRFVYEESLGAQDPRARNEALYDGDIRRADAYVGALRRRLEQLGLTDRTLVVIVSDHGEEFDDHFGVWNDGHGHSLYQEQVHVPLVFVGPRVQRRRVDHAVDLTAVAPTVLDFLDVEHPEGMDGRSLLGLLRGQQPSGEEDWLAFSEDVWIGPETRAIRTRDWKLIEQGEDLPERFVENERRRAIHKKIGQLSARMLFHLKADPRERTNRLADQVEMADGLRGRLQKRLASRARASPEGEIQVEGEALDRLRALGYVQ